MTESYFNIWQIWKVRRRTVHWVSDCPALVSTSNWFLEFCCVYRPSCNWLASRLQNNCRVLVIVFCIFLQESSDFVVAWFTHSVVFHQNSVLLKKTFLAVLCWIVTSFFLPDPPEVLGRQRYGPTLDQIVGHQSLLDGWSSIVLGRRNDVVEGTSSSNCQSVFIYWREIEVSRSPFAFWIHRVEDYFVALFGVELHLLVKVGTVYTTSVFIGHFEKFDTRFNRTGLRLHSRAV